MAITTVTEVKALNQISGSTYDTTIQTLIPLISDFIVQYTKLSEPQIETCPGLRLAAAQMIKHQLSNQASGVSAETIGDYSVSYNTDYPDFVYKILDSYKYPNAIYDAYYDSYYEGRSFFRQGVAETGRW